MYELRQLWDELLREVRRQAQGAIAPFTIGGKLDRGTPNAVGHVPVAGGGTGHEQGAEPPLGNPSTSGQVLASTTAGVRSWVTPSTGTPGATGSGAVPSDPTTTAGDLLYRNPHAGPTTIPVGFIGDSITEGSYLSPTIPAQVATDLTGHGLTVTAYNQGHGGAKAADWLPGAASGYYAAAIAAFDAAGVRLVHLMLGTNEAAQTDTLASYRANMIALLAALVGHGYMVMLSDMPASTDGTTNTRLQAEIAEIPTLCNGVTVLHGATEAYAYFIAHQSSLILAGLHPDQASSAVVATYWASHLQPLVLALAGPLALDRLGIGATGQALVVAGGLPAWGTPALADSGVAAGTYTNATVTVDAKGRVTLASSGSVIAASFRTEILVSGNPPSEEITANDYGPDPIYSDDNDYIYCEVAN